MLLRRLWRRCTGLLLACCLLVGCALRAEAWAETKPLRQVSGIAFDAEGNLYIADAASHQIWESTLGGVLTLVAGTGVQGYAGDGGPATAAELNEPQGLAFGPDGTMYVADAGNQRVRAISPQGVITTIAGTGVPGYGGDGSAATAALLRRPRAVAVDSTGNVLVCDTGNQRVRRIRGGLIATVAGSGIQGFGGDDGSALAAALNLPSGLAVAPDGRMFVADTGNQRVRVVDSQGVVATAAGTGVQGFAGDGGSPLQAMMSRPGALAWTPDGSLLIADEGNQRVRRVTGDVITTAAGSGVEGGSADGAAALQASMRGPRALAVSGFGLPVVADALSGTVRELTESQALFQPAGLAGDRTSAVDAQAVAALTYGVPAAVAVSVTGKAGVARGRVVVEEGGADLASGALAATPTSLTVNGLGAGSHALAVSYLGDGLNPAGSAAVVNVSVAPAIATATASSTEVAFGAPLPAFSGSLAGVLPADAGAVQATFTTAAGPTPPVGSYPITATLSGSRAANYSIAMSSTSGLLQVVKAGTVAVLNAVPAAFAGVPLTLSASVSSLTHGAPTGTVQFLDGTTVIATAPVQAGQASAIYNAPPLGARNVAVQYLGDANYLPSLSAKSPITIAALPDFAIAPAAAVGASTVRGGSASFSLLVSAQPGPFTGAIALSATGLPQGATVSFSPPQVVPGTGSATVVMTVQTAAGSATAEVQPRPLGMGVAFAALAMGALVRRKRRGVLPWLLCTTIFLFGCGARTVGGPASGLLSQSYNLQVTGTATNLVGAVVTHATAVTLTVQQ